MKRFYLTTPIYYVNAAPHIGHTYTTIAADTIRRMKQMQGYDAVLTTGTDEHGQKVERSARAVGKSPEEFTALISNEFRSLWERLSLQIDRFQRTTNPQHHAVVQDLFKRCLANGYIYKGSYTGQYCVYDELYVTDAQPGDPCPDCGRTTETLTEENYFFKLSAFTDTLLKLHEENPEFLRPETRRNEVLAFLRGGLSDLSISRTTIKWGIPVPEPGNHVFYVWFDALATYMSAVAGEDRWPADLHLIGKEIVRFHAIYWPAFLLAADLPLPKQIFAHGWLLFENDKMSKSRGNIVRTMPIVNVMGLDALRYFLLREIVFGQDGSFSYDALVTRYNADLANGLGNLASRTLSMIQQYRDGKIPGPAPDSEIADAARATIHDALQSFDRFEFSKGLETIWALLSVVDKFIVHRAPWKLAKQPEAAALLDDTLATAAEVLRIVTVLLAPVLPTAAEEIWRQLGQADDLRQLPFEGLAWGQIPAGQHIGTIAPVFPRQDAAPAIARMKEMEAEETHRQAALLGKVPPTATEPAQEPEPSNLISIDDFAKVEMRVGQIVSAEHVKGADKLLHLQVDLAESAPRTILAGIAQAYHPTELVGRRIAVVTNLAPRKLRGFLSNGMILAASEEGGKPYLPSFPDEVPLGAKLK